MAQWVFLLVYSLHQQKRGYYPPRRKGPVFTVKYCSKGIGVCQNWEPRPLFGWRYRQTKRNHLPAEEPSLHLIFLSSLMGGLSLKGLVFGVTESLLRPFGNPHGFPGNLQKAIDTRNIDRGRVGCPSLIAMTSLKPTATGKSRKFANTLPSCQHQVPNPGQCPCLIFARGSFPLESSAKQKVGSGLDRRFFYRCFGVHGAKIWKWTIGRILEDYHPLEEP